jgi:hypothetical protein
MNEKELTKNVKVAVGVATIVIVVEVICAFFLKVMSKQLIGLFLTLQILVSMRRYRTILPAFSHIWLDVVENIIKFKVLKPEYLMKITGLKEGAMSLIGVKEYEVAGSCG